MVDRRCGSWSAATRPRSLIRLREPEVRPGFGNSAPRARQSLTKSSHRTSARVGASKMAHEVWQFLVLSAMDIWCQVCYLPVNAPSRCSPRPAFWSPGTRTDRMSSTTAAAVPDHRPIEPGESRRNDSRVIGSRIGVLDEVSSTPSRARSTAMMLARGTITRRLPASVEISARRRAHSGSAQQDQEQEHDQRHVADGVRADQGQRCEDGQTCRPQPLWPAGPTRADRAGQSFERGR